LPATSFQWLENAPSFEMKKIGYYHNGTYEPQWQALRSINWLSSRGDRNGDGVPDWGDWYIDAEGNYKGDNDDTAKACEINPATYQTNCIYADFNLDGRTDLWRTHLGAFELAYSTKAGPVTWFTINIPLGLQPREFIVDMADYNGDGWPDIVMERSEYYDEFARNDLSTGELYLYLHTGNPASPYTSTGQQIYSHTIEGDFDKAYRDSSIQMLGDMDGNGLPDFLESTNTPYSEETTVDSPIPRNLYLTKLDSQGNVYFDVTNIFVGPPRTEAVYFNLFMDINGDGLSDWISVEGLTGYRLNKGGSFTEWRAFMGNWHLNLRSVPIVTGGEVGGPGGETIHGIQIYPRYSAAFRPYDFNADGKQELLIPGTHLAKACLDVRDNGVYERRCGDELYDVVDNAPGGAIEYGPPIPNIDDSIFQFNAVKFIEDADGIISAQVVNTPIIGSATQVASFDAYGNGLQDFIFTYGCRDHYNGNCELTEIDNELAGKDFGAYIMRNRGASSQADGYEPVDMLASVQNGLGVKDEWDYRPLSSTRYDIAGDPYYERDTGYYDGLSSEDKNKYFNFSSSMYAVAEHRKSDGVGGLNSTRYRYKDAMFNRE
ncbi:FG-GAP repeat domain-containing protein, partial [Aliikangiella maris]